MEIFAKLKERFCKDCNIPIKIFHEPYFMDRMNLYDQFYDTMNQWDTFVTELENYKCEQDFYEDYNRIKDAAINDIKTTEAYQRFNNEDMNKFSITHKGLPSKDIFHPSNDGKKFISIDMRKANFSALSHYDSDMFYGAKTWEEFIGRYTDNKHIINSKYIRQVILGNCNPKRHITYEKCLMEIILDDIVLIMFDIKDVVFFSNDEIVIDVSNMNELDQVDLRLCFLEESLKSLTIPFKVELFTLRKIEGASGYYKEFDNGNVEFKCLDNYMLPFVMRKMLGQEVTEHDKVFYHEGLLAKFIKIPEIKNI
jgi:hypothetical protein